MRGIVQRVLESSVTVEGEVISKIGKGMCVLVGIDRNDDKSMIPWMVKKLLSLKIYDNTDGKPWAKNITDVNGSILIVSQFTLCHVLKGAKPDFHNAMKGSESQPFFDEFVAAMRAAYKPENIETGAFGEYMNVNIVNDGPVTLVVDAPQPPPQKEDKKFSKRIESSDDSPKSSSDSK